MGNLANGLRSKCTPGTDGLLSQMGTGANEHLAKDALNTNGHQRKGTLGRQTTRANEHYCCQSTLEKVGTEAIGLMGRMGTRANGPRRKRAPGRIDIERNERRGKWALGANGHLGKMGTRTYGHRGIWALGANGHEVKMGTRGSLALGENKYLRQMGLWGNGYLGKIYIGENWALEKMGADTNGHQGKRTFGGKRYPSCPVPISLNFLRMDTVDKMSIWGKWTFGGKGSDGHD